MTNVLSLLCALGLLAGAFAFASHGSNSVSFVQLAPASSAQAAEGGARLPA